MLCLLTSSMSNEQAQLQGEWCTFICPFVQCCRYPEIEVYLYSAVFTATGKLAPCQQVKLSFGDSSVVQVSLVYVMLVVT